MRTLALALVTLTGGPADQRVACEATAAGRIERFATLNLTEQK